MATLAVVEPEAMNSTAPEALPSKQNGDIPDAAYQPIWSFLLDSNSGTSSSLDFKDIRLFMLANKNSKGAFNDCGGWWWCDQALRREIAAKESMMFIRPGYSLDQAIKMNSCIISIYTFLYALRPQRRIYTFSSALRQQRRIYTLSTLRQQRWINSQRRMNESALLNY
jgi:hypothetical protein